MSWEMQQHMFEYIHPSIEFYLDKTFESEEDKRNWVVDQLLEYKATPEHLGLDSLVDLLSDYVSENGITDNGAHKFYVDPEGRTMIPWCSEHEMLAFYG